MDIANLNAFIAVAQSRSFSRSAENLQITQPAVSKRISALEASLSSQLFDRVGRSVHLTEVGNAVLPSALKIQSEVDRIKNEICNLGNNDSGRIEIGITDHLCNDFLSDLTRLFVSNYPLININLRYYETDVLLAKIDSGTIDLGFCVTQSVTPNSSSYDRLIFLNVSTENLKIVVDRQHPLANETNIGFEVLNQYMAVLPPAHTLFRSSIDQLMAHHNAKPHKVMEINDFASIKSYIKMGLGWGCLPDSLVIDDLIEIEVSAFDINHSVSLVRNRAKSLTYSGRAFLDTLDKVIS